MSRSSLYGNFRSYVNDFGLQAYANARKFCTRRICYAYWIGLFALFPLRLSAESLVDTFLVNLPTSSHFGHQALSPSWQPKVTAQYDDGTCLEIVFVDPLSNNTPMKRIVFYPHGQIQAEFDLTGDGVSCFYDEDGMVFRICKYVQDKLHGEFVENYPSGSTQRACVFRNGLLDGFYAEYYEDGSKKVDGFYRNGLLHGEYSEWFQNGKKRVSSTYQDGLLKGKRSVWDESGQLREVSQYTNGFLHDPKGQSALLTWSATGASLKKASFQMGCSLEPQTIGKAVPLQGRKEGFSPHRVAQFVDGLRVLDTQEWFDNGKLALKCSFSQLTPGILQGMYETWYPNGKLRTQGSFEEGKPCGEHVAWYENGQKAFSKKYQKGELDGVATSWYPSGALQSQESFSMGSLSGNQKSFYENGQAAVSNTYENGLLEGPYAEWYESGAQSIQAEYHLGKLDKSYTEWFEDGTIFKSGEYLAGLPTGVHLRYKEGIVERRIPYSNGVMDGLVESFASKDQKIAEIPYSKGLVHGKKRLWNSTGSLIFSGEFAQGVPIGTHSRITPDGFEEVTQYKEGRLHGPFIQYYPLQAEVGRVKAIESQYIDGLLDGKYIEFNSAGTRQRQIPYAHGLKHGQAVLYADDGKVAATCTFKDDLLDGQVSFFFPDGALFKTMTYSRGLIEGEETTYYDSGKIAGVNRYKGGLLDGLCFELSPDGTLLFEGEYKNGLKHGKFNKYHADGSLKVAQEFIEDKKVK